MNKQQKLEKWAEKEIKRNLDHMIVNDDNGGYVAFGKYHLEPQTHGVQVSTWDRTIHVFANKRTALSWCVADKYNQFSVANNILVLDRKKQLLAADIHCRRGMAERGRTSLFYETVNTKIEPKVAQYNSVNAELEKCINSAKYMQIRGFNNETARTSGT